MALEDLQMTCTIYLDLIVTIFPQLKCALHPHESIITKIWDNVLSAEMGELNPPAVTLSSHAKLRCSLEWFIY